MFWGMVWGSFNMFLGMIGVVLVWFGGVLGCFNGPREDKSYAYLPEPCGK